MLTYSSTPVQELHDPMLEKAGVRLLIKREDLNHPLVSGNKWWKLKYNLEEARNQHKNTLLTFGGAYSNHIFAVAAAAHDCEFKSIGVIRGEEALPLNETLAFAKNQGMLLHYISREQYRKKTEPVFINLLHSLHGDFYLIPEGGTNALAVKGVTEFAQALGSNFDYLCCSVGTGGTLAGLINGISADKTILGFASLKGGDYLNAEVSQWLESPKSNWRIISDYHFGGYGKIPDTVRVWQKNFYRQHKILLDLVYGSKMMTGIFDLITTGFFSRGSTILVIHTGGLQGKSLL